MGCIQFKCVEHLVKYRMRVRVRVRVRVTVKIMTTSLLRWKNQRAYQVLVHNPFMMMTVTVMPQDPREW